MKQNRNIKRYIFPALAVLLILAVSFALWYFPNEYAYRLQPPWNQNHKPVYGVWDLTGFDLDNQIIFLDGPVEYIPGALLTPEEFDAYEGEIPYEWVYNVTDVATARLRFVFPDDNIYTLASCSVEYNERVYVNGQWRHDIGLPGLTADASVPGSGFIFFDVKPENGVVEIVRQSSNFVHKEGGGFDGYFAGSPSNIRQMAAVSDLFTAISLGLFLCLFVLHLILYLILRSYRPNLWFALLCLAWLLRTGFTGHYLYWAAFPKIPWTLVYRLGCISVAFSGILILLIVRDQFPGAVQKRPLRVLIIAQAAFIPFYALADTVLCSRVKVFSEILLLVAASYLAVRFVIWLPRRIRKKELLLEQMITLVGISVALFAVLNDTILYNRIESVIFCYEIGDAGMLVLVLFQMMAMIFATLRQLTEARQEAQLALENAELSGINEKLALVRAEKAEKELELLELLIADIPKESLVTCGALTLDLVNSRAYLKADDLLLAPKDLTLLYCFIRREGEIVGRDTLHEDAWKSPLPPRDRAIDSSIYRLRKKLIGSGYEIKTVRGQGFLFEKE